MNNLETRSLILGYDGPPIVQSLDLQIPPGKITALVGPNGCGKSTLLRGMARLLKPQGGAVYLDGNLIWKLPTREVARQLGLLPQNPVAPEGLLVRELVAQGRYPHQGIFKQWTPKDDKAVAEALDITNMTELAERPLDALSGGQRQRAWIAMALAQETELLLLDEPTTYLDLAHQLEVFHLLEKLNREQGRTIVMVVHDLNQAGRYSHHIVAMSRGKIFTSGTPREVINSTVLREVFGVEALILNDPHSDVPFCVPFGLRPTAASTDPMEVAPEKAVVYANA